MVGYTAFAEYPTLELRAPDCCTRLDDAIAIAALYRVLARYLYGHAEHNAELDVVDRSIAVENKWRAQRYGAQGTFVTRSGGVAVSDMLDTVLDRLPPMRRPWPAPIRWNAAARSLQKGRRPTPNCGFLLKMNTKGPRLRYIRSRSGK